MAQTVEVNIKEEETILSGTWKFHPKLCVEEVGSVAQELLENEPGAYRSMQVRKNSRGQFVICFVYDCGAPAHSKAVYDDFMHRMTDLLKRRFGNDFVGWDVANEVWTLTTYTDPAPQKLLAFWEHALTELQKQFPASLADWQCVRNAINKAGHESGIPYAWKSGYKYLDANGLVRKYVGGHLVRIYFAPPEVGKRDTWCAILDLEA
jgi:hypothetical protein